MPGRRPLRGAGVAGPAAVSIVLHAVVLGAVAGLIGWSGGGGDPQRELVIGFGQPQLRAPAVEPDVEPIEIAHGDDPEPEVQPVAEEFPVALYEAIVAAGAPPAWSKVPPRERRKETKQADALAAAAVDSKSGTDEVIARAAKPLRAPEAPKLHPDRCPPPEYPRQARRRNLEGTVWLRLRVSSDGLPAEVILETSSGHALLDEAALAAARAWKLTPATCDGLPCEGILRVPVTFRLEAQAAGAPE